MDMYDELKEVFSDAAVAVGVVVAFVLVVVFFSIGYIIVSISYMRIMECMGLPSSYAWIPFYRKYLAGDYASRVTEPTFGTLSPFIKWCWCFSGLVSSIPIIGKFVAMAAGIFNTVVRIVSVYKTQNESVGLAILTFFFPGLWGFIVGKRDVK